MTVNGALPAQKLGKTLPHEHLLVDFIGAAEVSPDRYDADDVFRQVLPVLTEAKEAGCETFVDCTPAYLGRDPKLLQRFAKASGVHIVTNTGYYGAVRGKYLPRHAFDETADQLAARWTKEWSDGIGDTGIKPGLIKIGVDRGKLTDVNRKLIQAAARCHLKTGLTIAAHSGDGIAAMEQLDVLAEEGVSPSAWIWVHAQTEFNAGFHKRAAKAGAWIELDGLRNSRKSSLERHLGLVKILRDASALSRTLLSHDSGWYNVGQAKGGAIGGYTVLFEQFLPELKDAGFSEAEISQLIITNPARALTVGVRNVVRADTR